MVFLKKAYTRGTANSFFGSEAYVILSGKINLVSRLLSHFVKSWGTSLCC